MSGADRAEQLRKGLEAIWQQSLPHLRAQLETLEAAAHALLAGQLDGEVQRTAERAAHRLAGSLGTFGLQEGTRAARALEHLFAGSNTPDPRLVSEEVTALRDAINKKDG